MLQSLQSIEMGLNGGTTGWKDIWDSYEYVDKEMGVTAKWQITYADGSSAQLKLMSLRP